MTALVGRMKRHSPRDTRRRRYRHKDKALLQLPGPYIRRKQIGISAPLVADCLEVLGRVVVVGLCMSTPHSLDVNPLKFSNCVIRGCAEYADALLLSAGYMLTAGMRKVFPP
jgi:hypothetical protein